MGALSWLVRFAALPLLGASVPPDGTGRFEEHLLGSDRHPMSNSMPRP
jgi:hypothetical protein